MPLGSPRSAPGYVLTLLSVLTILRQIIAFVDVSPVMAEFHIRDENSVKILALIVTVQKLYEFLGALLDNKHLYILALVSRIVSSGIMYWVGAGWENYANIEMGGAWALGAAMWWDMKD